MDNIDFVKEHYLDQISALNAFIKDAYPFEKYREVSMNAPEIILQACHDIQLRSQI